MTSLIKVILVVLAEILLSIGANYLFYFKFLLAKNLNLQGRKFAWAGACWLMLFWDLLFYVLYCMKQYVCPNEFYELQIQIFAYAGLYISMILTSVIAISALKSR